MRRNNRRPLKNEESETKKIVIISLSVLIIAVLAFVITFAIYSNYLNNDIDLSEFETSPITDLGMINEIQSSEASSAIGKSVNEMQEASNEITNTTNTQKIAINTSNMD